MFTQGTLSFLATGRTTHLTTQELQGNAIKKNQTPN